MHILITGGTGLIGQRLIKLLLTRDDQITVLSRKPLRPAFMPGEVEVVQWDGKSGSGWKQLVETVDIIINLAGAGVADARWTAHRKQVILNSRIEAGHAIVEAVQAARNKPKLLIQASAVGYYGTSEAMTMTEDSPVGDDFLAKVCLDWEVSVKPIEAMGIRTAYIRTGIVLDPKGGALPKIVMPFKLFAGGPIGSGRQWMSWIHHEDEVEAIRFIIDHETLSGPINLTAPTPETNKAFAQTLGQVMKRPAILPTPSLALKAMFGELSTVLLEGQKVLPATLTQAGFQFKYPDLTAALTNLLHE